MTNLTTIEGGKYSDITLEIQKALVKAGYELTVDGYYGQETRNAIDKYKLEKNLSTDQDVINSLFPKRHKINWLGFLGPILISLITKGSLPMFTKAFVMQLVRDGLKLIGGTGFGAGLATADEWTMIAGGVSLAVGIIWGFVARNEDNAAK